MLKLKIMLKYKNVDSIKTINQNKNNSYYLTPPALN